MHRNLVLHWKKKEVLAPQSRDMVTWFHPPGNSMGNSESSYHTVNLFLHRRTAPAWAWLPMGERCVQIKFIRSACLPSKTWRVETSSFFSRTTTTSLLTSYLWGFRGIGVAQSWMNVRWVVVVVVVVVLFLRNVPWVKNHILLESRL